MYLLKALYNLPKQYFRLYDDLQIPRIDNRLIVLRQLSKRNLLSNLSDDKHIKRIALALSQKPLYAWQEQNFAHISGLKYQDAIGLLVHHDKLERFIPQMKTWLEANLLIRNCENIQDYNTIDEIKENLIKIDEAWDMLVEKMEFSEEFQCHN